MSFILGMMVGAAVGFVALALVTANDTKGA